MSNANIINEEALNTLLHDKQKEEVRRSQQRNMLKESYERQIKEKIEKNKREREMEKQYFFKQQDYLDY